MEFYNSELSLIKHGNGVVTMLDNSKCFLMSIILYVTRKGYFFFVRPSNSQYQGLVFLANLITLPQALDIVFRDKIM